MDKITNWIKIEDELPEVGQTVIVARPNEYSGNVDVLKATLYDSGESGTAYGKIYDLKWLYGKFWALPATTPLDNISHWMPLPEPPEATERFKRFHEKRKEKELQNQKIESIQNK